MKSSKKSPQGNLIVNLDLYHEDYEKIVDYCKNCGRPDSIEDFINHKLKKYGPDNPGLSTNLIECIEKRYPEVFEAFDEEEPFHERDVSHFASDMPDIKNPQLHWLFSYLFFECDWLPVKPSENASIFTTFVSEISVEDLKSKYVQLQEQKLIGECSFKNFSAVFSGIEIQGKQFDKIQWCAVYNNKNHLRKLFNLIYSICPKEINDADQAKGFIWKVIQCFENKDGKNFTTISLKSSFSRWKRGIEYAKMANEIW